MMALTSNAPNIVAWADKFSNSLDRAFEQSTAMSCVYGFGCV